MYICNKCGNKVEYVDWFPLTVHLHWCRECCQQSTPEQVANETHEEGISVWNRMQRFLGHPNPDVDAKLAEFMDEGADDGA